MKRITQDVEGTWLFSDYFKYIELMRPELSERVSPELLEKWAYSINDKRSLHDARMTSILFSDPNSRSKKNPSLTINLLGPYFDRRIKIFYLNPFFININISSNQLISKADVIIHELEAIEMKGIQHEIFFDKIGHISIGCERIEFATERA